MKERKSHRGKVARLAYIFATMVTIFAQMGAAVPAMIADADTQANPTGMTITEVKTIPSENPDVSTHILEVNGPTAPADGSSFTINLLGAMQNLIDTKTDQLNSATMTGTGHSTLGEIASWVSSILGAGSNNSSTTLYVSGWIITPSADKKSITVKKDSTYKGPSMGSSTKTIVNRTPWPMYIAYTSDSSQSAGLQVDGSDTPIALSENNTLNLATYNHTDTNYKVGDEVDLQATDQNMIDGGEVDVSKSDISQYLQFDQSKTDALLQNAGYSKSTATAADVSQYADDAASASTITKYTDSNQKYFYLLNVNGDARIVWPPSDAKSQRSALIAFKAIAANSALAITPTYLSSLLKGKDGTGVTLNIKNVPNIDGSKLKLDVTSITKDGSNNTGSVPYRMSDFPLFYLTEKSVDGTKDLYSFLYNAPTATNQAGSMNTLRKSVLYDKSSYTAMTSLAKVMTNSEAASFENFNAINADGSIVSGSQQLYQSGKTYTLIPYDQRAGLNHFVRISGTGKNHNYYMPDGVPTFTLDDTGNVTLVDKGDGRAKTGQWSASGQTINAKLYKVKKVKVIDQSGAVVNGATLTLNSTSNNKPSMKATTGAAGTGELVPSDYSDESKDAFYYPNGTQTFGSLSLPAGYSQDVAFSGVDLDSTADTFKPLTNAKNAALSNDGQTLILTVHQYTDLDKKISIQKVAKSDLATGLANAQFNFQEVDSPSDAIATQTLTTDANGMASVPVDPTSNTAQRIFHITETTAPKGYDITAPNGYYATWTQGKGFTAVGTSQTNQAATSSDGLVDTNNGTLRIADSPLLFPGGNKSAINFEYVNAAGNPISGAQLPVLSDTATYPGTNNLGMSGIGGIVYNPASDVTKLKTPDSGIVAGTGVAHDSIMYTSGEKSDANGLGIVQTLWSELGISNNWQSLDQSSNAYKLSKAIVNGTIPTSPTMAYSLISPDQQKRAEGTTASDYYSLGGSVVIGQDDKGVLTANSNAGTSKFNAANRDNAVSADTSSNTVKVTLFKVKHIAIKDANGVPVVGATVRFTNLVTAQPTDSKGEAELVPADSDGNPTTSFAWPDAKQYLVSAKDASGNDLDLGAYAKQWAMSMHTPAAQDILESSGVYLSNISISNGTTNPDHANGQYVEMQTNTAQTKTVINIHKQSAFNADKPVAGVTFKVWPANKDINSSVTTAATDTNGNTTATLTAASPNGQYVIQEQTLSSSVAYQQDKFPHVFTADVSGKVSAVNDGETVISADSDGVLHFADTPTANNTPVGDNGTNGGVLSLKKVDLDNPTNKVPDGATFSLTEVGGSGVNTTLTIANGVAKADLGAPINGTRTFAIQETGAPSGYAKNNTVYHLQIDKDGKMTLGNATDDNPTADHTADNVLSFVSATDHTLKYGDVTNAAITIKKQNTAGVALPGATFDIVERSATGGIASNPMPQKIGLKTGDNGTIQFTPNATSGTHYYLVTEQVAPNGYAKGPAEMIVYQAGTGIVGIKSATGTDTTTAMKKTGDNSVSYTDQLASGTGYPLKIRQQNAKASTYFAPDLKGDASSGFTISLVNAKNALQVLNIDVNSVKNSDTGKYEFDGNALVQTQAMATAMGENIMPTNGYVDLYVTIKPKGANYTVPLPREIRFYWASGFKLPSNTTYSYPGVPYYDTMVNDDTQDNTKGNADTPANQVGKGGLRFVVRRDTLAARSSVADESGSFAMAPNASFNLAYTDSTGKSLGTQTVTTNSVGVAVLQGPTVTGNYAGIFKNVDVTMTQTSATPGYQLFTPTVKLKYDSAAGYSLATGIPVSDSNGNLTYAGQYDVDATMPGTLDDSAGTGIEVTDPTSKVTGEGLTYGGSQVVVPLTPQPSVTLTSAPQVMNFGQAQVFSGVQTMNLLPSDSTETPASFDTSMLDDDAIADGTTTTDSKGTDTSGNVAHSLNAQVVQANGAITSGWSLKMAMSTLTSEDGLDTIPDSSVTMGTPTVYRTNDGNPSDDSTDLNMGYGQTINMTGKAPNTGTKPDLSSNQEAKTLVNTGTNSSVGTYNIAWNVDDVKMNLPAMSGKLNTNYHSTVSWDLVTAP